jgi:hypothetical protein
MKLEAVASGDPTATQLLVALLQLELLSARLPCTLRRPLCTLGWALQNRLACVFLASGLLSRVGQ